MMETLNRSDQSALAGRPDAPDASAQETALNAQIEAACHQACQTIAPAWPLDRAIAVNPHWSRIGMPVRRVAARMAVLGGIHVFPPRDSQQKAWEAGRISRVDLELVEAVEVVERVAGHLAKYRVLAVEPLAPVQRHEELRAVRVGTLGGHRNETAMREAQPAVEFVLEFGAEDGLAALARSRGVARLRHEVPDHPVEDAAVIVALEAQLHKVAARHRRLLGPQLDVERPDARMHDHFATGDRLVGVHRERRHVDGDGRRRPSVDGSA
jgi:hypothetical protein